jgi:hypothetical protein
MTRLMLWCPAAVPVVQANAVYHAIRQDLLVALPLVNEGILASTFVNGL